MSEKIETLTDATFDEHVKASDVPVLVDFWAEWCGPCKMISPVLEEIAEEQAGKIRIGKLNIDDNLDVTRRFDVMSIPTLILFKDGEPAGTPDRGQAQGPAARGDLGLPVGLPLAVGDRGDAVSDVQHRLIAILPGRPHRCRRHLRPRHPGRRRGLPASPRASASTASAALRPGTPWSRPVFGSVTASSTAGRPCCGVTTWRNCSSASARSASTPAGSTASSGTPPCGPSTSSSATPASRSTASSGGATLQELVRLESRHHEPELVSAVRARAALRDAPRPCAVATSRLARAVGWAASPVPCGAA